MDIAQPLVRQVCRTVSLLCLLLLPGCATDKAIKEIEQEFVIPESMQAARLAAGNGDYGAAIEKYRATLADNPGDSMAKLELSSLYLLQGDAEPAEVLLQEVLVSCGADFTHVLVAELGVEQEEAGGGADGDSEQGLAKGEDLTASPVVEGGEQLGGNTGELAQGSILPANCAKAWTDLGMIADIRSDYFTAERYYLEALQAEKNNADIYNNYGYSLMMSRRYIEAEEVLRQGLNLDPRFKRLKNNLALCKAWQKDYSEALQIYSADLDDPEAYNSIGYIAMLNEDYDLAISYFEEAVSLSPTYYLKAAKNLNRAVRLKKRAALL